MMIQNRVVLSIGSNQGNKEQNIQKCITLLHHHVGTIIKISKLYETAAWGFEGDFFYNIVLLLHTYETAAWVLERILKIEESMGRVRNLHEGYESRGIDIDILFFNEEIVLTDRLQIPHPHLQNRLFILVPLCDLGLSICHPILKKDCQTLLSECTDRGYCIAIGSLEGPLDRYRINKHSYLVIEGNIGVGKTSLTCRLAEDFGAKTILERYEENSFLIPFYEDRTRFAFLLEINFLRDRYEQLQKDLSHENGFFIGDYSIFKSLIFAKITLAEMEYKVYKTFFDLVCKAIRKPDVYIYLYQKQDKVLQHIRKRKRPYEQNIDSDYLTQIEQGYLDFIKNNTSIPVVAIDLSQRDFVNHQPDYIAVLDILCKGMV